MGIGSVANLHLKTPHPPAGYASCMNILKFSQFHCSTGHAVLFTLGLHMICVDPPTWHFVTQTFTDFYLFIF